MSTDPKLSKSRRLNYSLLKKHGSKKKIWKDEKIFYLPQPHSWTLEWTFMYELIQEFAFRVTCLSSHLSRNIALELFEFHRGNLWVRRRRLLFARNVSVSQSLNKLHLWISSAGFLEFSYQIGIKPFQQSRRRCALAHSQPFFLLSIARVSTVTKAWIFYFRMDKWIASGFSSSCIRLFSRVHSDAALLCMHDFALNSLEFFFYEQAESTPLFMSCVWMRCHMSRA